YPLLDICLPPLWLCLNLLEPGASLRVEQVSRVCPRPQMDPLAGTDLVALAECGHDLTTAVPGDDLRLRAGRLDNGNVGRNPIDGGLEMRGPEAVPPSAARRLGGTGSDRKSVALRRPHRACVGRDPPLDKIHRRRADEARHEPIDRPVVELERRADLF